VSRLAWPLLRERCSFETHAAVRLGAISASRRDGPALFRSVTAHGLEVVVGIAEGSRADCKIAGEALERAVIAAGANIADVPHQELKYA
jgi:hypothetical protein